MLPVECVVRNIATGSLCRRLGLEDGIKFEDPLFEFFLKDDDLGDPLINDNHITAFGWGTEQEISEMKEITFKINQLLCDLFKDVGLILVDYKVEYGRSNASLILGDEFTPDGCRIWDAETGESLDKDRFRKDLGDVVESYQIVAHKLGISLQFFTLTPTSNIIDTAMKTKAIYFDYASTTPVDPRVAKKMHECLLLDGNFGNPSSRSHEFGWKAEEVVEKARFQVADLINADSREIVWTSGATESDNLAIKGAAKFYKDRGNHIITSKIEHKAVLDPCRQL